MQSSLCRRVGRDIRRACLISRRRYRDDLKSWNSVHWIHSGSTTKQRFPGERQPTENVFDLPSRQFHFSSSFPSKSSAMNLSPVSAAHHAYFHDDDEESLDKEVDLLAQKYLDFSFQRSLDLELGEASIWDDFSESNELSYMGDADVDDEEIPHETAKSFDEILAEFQPDNPPPVQNLEELQIWLECSAVEESAKEIQKSIDSARSRHDYASMGFVQRHVVRWFPALRDTFADLQKDYIMKKERDPNLATGASIFGPFLSLIPPEKLAVIAAHHGIIAALSRPNKDGFVPYVHVCQQLGQAVEDEIVIQRVIREKRLQNKLAMEAMGIETSSEDDGGLGEENFEEEGLGEGKFEWIYNAAHLKGYINELTKNDSVSAHSNRALKLALSRTKRALESEAALTVREKIHVGAILFYTLLNHAKCQVDGKKENVFRHEMVNVHKKGMWKKVGVVSLNESFHQTITSDDVKLLASTTTRYKPMVIPPKSWTGPNEGGYLWLKTPLMRFQDSKLQEEVLHYADLTTILDGLNVLGNVPWKVNEKVLEAAQRCWDEDFPLGEIPTRTDFEMPPKPERPMFAKQEKGAPVSPEKRAEWRKFKEDEYKYKRVKQRNNDLRSLRCTVELKLGQARQFMAFGKFYFPFNVDFRGRTYPVPPHFSTVGSDLCRGMLRFAESKPLGKKGLFWLKVHLANLGGHNKVSFDDRVAFVDENIENIRMSAKEPFEGERWWTKLEDPFQGLATCIEIVNAIDSGDPESYMCSHPVHMDGSCNGLQHYAALGLDASGGKAVNLCPEDKPQDIYSAVMHEVVRRVAEEAKRKLDFETPDPEKSTPEEFGEFLNGLSAPELKEYKAHHAAQLVDGLIDRGVVKRTVMTNVYGVTFIGAREQIQEKIQEKMLAKDPGRDIDDKQFQSDLHSASAYLAKLTMHVIVDLFSGGAQSTMDWLTTCARKIARHGYPVAWISPIGVPVVQPYRSTMNTSIVTVSSTVKVAEQPDHLPLQKSKQVTAFLPNFVHSLDSSHMVLTALEMDRRGLTFTAVHDSYWTHPCDIDEMNKVLRDVFVELYSRPILSELKESWEIRYPDIEFPDVPEQGDLDLEMVKKAPYFFQ